VLSFGFFFEKRLKPIPRIMLDKMCDKYKITPILYSPNRLVPTAPITKIGPEVVQKIDIFLASLSEIKPFWKSSDIIFAPIGYPDNILIKNANNDIPGVPNNFWENLSHFLVILNTKPSSISSFVKSINGNSPGMTAVIKRLIPSIVPFEYFDGFEIINSITRNISIEKIVSEKINLFFEKVLLKWFDFVGFIWKYMLK